MNAQQPQDRQGERGQILIALVGAIFVHTLQLQREPPKFSGSSTSKRTAPQWQLPLCFRLTTT